MKKLTKFVAGAAAAAVLSVSAAAPAEAQYRYRDRGLDVGDVITGVAVVGGIAAIASALGRDGSRYGYGYRDRYRDDYRNAVNSCSYEAERAGRGRVSVTDVDRRGSYSYRVRGWIEGGYDYRDNRYGDRYDRGYERDYRYGDRDYRSGGYGDRVAFTCTARSDGRVTDFRLNNNYRW